MDTSRATQLTLLLMLLFSALSQSTWSATLYSCPNVAVDTTSGNGPAIYSNCVVTIPTYGEQFVFLAALGDRTELDAEDTDIMPDLSPPASPELNLGTWDEQDSAQEDMGPNYTGDCTDMASPIPTATGDIDLVAGNTVCVRVSLTDMSSLWIRGTWTGATFTSPMYATNSPKAKPAQPVPVMPALGFIVLGGLLAFSGLRKIQ